MRTDVVIGLGFGDEGKGLTTDYLCRQAERPIVVRFSGGHQAGHTVVTADGRRHVFSNFGAGAFAGAPTYWSRNCTFHPVGYRSERQALLELGVEPVLFVDDLSPVTTPYDILFNRQTERESRHGSCGLGFGATVGRHEGPAKLHVMDLYDDFVLGHKLSAVADWYGQLPGASYSDHELSRQLEAFYESVDYVRAHLPRTRGGALLSGAEDQYDRMIFEGSQGLLLDQEFGYFPHVTRAHVSCRNAMSMVREFGLPKPSIHYVTRAYQTRHGNGPLTNDHLAPTLHPTPDETNIENPWQGEQRRSLLDVDQLKFALAADDNYAHRCCKHLVVTCLDQLRGPWFATEAGRRIELRGVSDLATRLGGDWAGIYGNAGEVGQLKPA